MSQGVVSKMVERRQRNAGDLLSAIQQHEAQVAGELEATLGGGAAGSEVVGVGSVLRAMVRAEEGALAAMVAADLAHDGELSDDEVALTERDEAFGRARAAVLEAKEGVAAVFGEVFARRVRLAGRLPETHDGLLLLLGQVVEKLKDPDNASPAPVKLAVTMNLDVVIPVLEEAQQQLKDALARVKDEESQARATLLAKQKAIAAFDETHRRMVALFNGLVLGAGLEGLGGFSVTARL
jgi:hypothetical protein